MVFGGVQQALYSSVWQIYATQTQTSSSAQMAGFGMTQIPTWAQWTSGTGTTPMTANIIWTAWSSATNGMVGTSNYARAVSGQQTPEEQAARIQRQQVAAPGRGGPRAEAETRAKSLMRDNLTPMQREALEKHGWFLVEGGKSGKLYRVHARGYAGNIDELDDKMNLVARLCVHAPTDIPLGDQLLAQALSLRFDEDHVIAKANRSAMAA